MESYGETFKEEAREVLGELEAALLELEKSPFDREIIGRVFRALHTLKGSGAMSGFNDIASFVHELETAFEEVRNGRMAVSRDLVTLTLAARDLMSEMLESISSDRGCLPTEADGIIRSLRTMLAEAGLATQVEEGDRKSRIGGGEAVSYRLRFRPHPDIFRKGLNPLGLFRELEELGELKLQVDVEAVPPLDEIDPESCYLAWDGVLTTSAGIDAIRDVFIFVEEDSELSIEPIDAPRPQAECGPKSPVPPDFEPGGVPFEREAGAVPTIRVRSAKLDTLVDLIGELVTVQARLSQVAAARVDADLDAVSEEVERLTWELRDQVLNIRMLPIGTTFSRFDRLARDLGEELGKDVTLTTEGAETELDKTVIERLSDPLVHLIRNCIDHGIEPSAARQAAGKPARGRVHLAARHSGPHVIIEVSDDGAGIDPQAIRERAVAMGLPAAEAELGDRELFSLVFHSGLSTAPAVSTVSGRGVGMDVVKRAIDELRGGIDISSRPGEGSTFTLKLPLTLAIIDGLLVKIGGDFFIFPLAAVEECIELRQKDAEKADGRNLVDVRGEILPYIRLREQFSVDGRRPEIEQIVLTETDGQRVGFVVDEVVGEHQTVIKTLGRLYRDVEGISGATILGNGSVALILDLPELVQREESLACQGWK